MIKLLGLLGQFLLQSFERIHELFNLVFGVLVLSVFAFEKVVGFFQVFDQNAMIVIKFTLWFFRYLWWKDFRDSERLSWFFSWPVTFFSSFFLTVIRIFFIPLRCNISLCPWGFSFRLWVNWFSRWVVCSGISVLRLDTCRLICRFFIHQPFGSVFRYRVRVFRYVFGTRYTIWREMNV